MPTLATVANMRKYQRHARQVTTPEGETITVLPQQVFAYSPSTDERCSATPGDYYWMPDDEPLIDSEGEPMILVLESSQITDVAEDEQS